jgi:hypothetical protein
MPTIQPIQDSAIDAVIKDNQTGTPNPNKTNGKDLQDLLKLMRDRFEQEISKVKGASLYGPYADIATALAEITTERYAGLTIGIETQNGIVEHWWRNGIADNDLVPKYSQSQTIISTLPPSGVPEDGMEWIVYNP